MLKILKRDSRNGLCGDLFQILLLAIYLPGGTRPVWQNSQIIAYPSLLPWDYSDL